jgi:hypothetical protein
MRQRLQQQQKQQAGVQQAQHAVPPGGRVCVDCQLNPSAAACGFGCCGRCCRGPCARHNR